MKNIMIIGLLNLAVHFCFGQIETNELSLNRWDSTWIQKQQFPLLAYDGNNAAINERLMLAAKYRKQSVVYISTGLAVYVVGGIVGGYGFARLLGESLFSDSPDQSNPHLVVGGSVASVGLSLAIGGGSWKKAKARRRVEEAKQLYLNR
jgi:hypothetical protein